MCLVGRRLGSNLAFLSLLGSGSGVEAGIERINAICLLVDGDAGDVLRKRFVVA